MEACDAGCVWHLPLQQHVRLLLQADRKAPGILSEAQVSEFSRLPQLRLVALNSDSFSSIYRMFKFLVFYMVLILDAKSEHFAHIHRFFLEDLIKSLVHIKKQRLLLLMRAFFLVAF